MKLRVTVEGKVYEVDVEVIEEEGGAAPAAPAAAPATAPAPAPAKKAAPAPAAAAPAAPKPAAAPTGGKVFPSPMAGTIRAIHVKAGDTVSKDQELFTLEAMKMETAVAATAAGTVKAVLVDVGAPVQSGQALLELE